MVIINNGYKFQEQDDYETGCIPNTGRSSQIDLIFQGETSDILLKNIKDFFEIDNDEIEINACDEDGRIDISIIETEDSIKATEKDIEQWKKGKIKLYSVIYTFQIYELISTKL